MEPIHRQNDFYGWLADQTKLLRSRQAERLAWNDLAEELEAMAASQRRELKNRLHVLLLHLLKWQTQPIERTYAAVDGYRSGKKRAARLWIS